MTAKELNAAVKDTEGVANNRLSLVKNNYVYVVIGLLAALSCYFFYAHFFWGDLLGASI